MVASSNNAKNAAAAPQRSGARAGVSMHTVDQHDDGDGLPVSHTQRAWAEHHRSLRSFIARRLPRGSDVDDVMQTLFLNFHRHFGNGEPPTAPGAWLHQAARHAIVDRYRSATHRREESVGDFDGVASLAVEQSAVAPEELPAPSLASCVRPLMARLSATDREALTLTELDGMTQQDAAARSGISLPGMKARVQRARRRLRAAFDACCELTFDGRGQVLSAQPRAGRPCPCPTRSSSRTGTC
jgi:RNA polymerase sigma-70 factor, ECF subfamily